MKVNSFVKPNNILSCKCCLIKGNALENYLEFELPVPMDKEKSFDV